MEGLWITQTEEAFMQSDFDVREGESWTIHGDSLDSECKNRYLDWSI